MTNPICRVASCDRPVAEGFVCARCAHDFERALGDIPAVVHQLNLTLAKQTRYADRAERGGNEQPLPMDPVASAVLDELRSHMRGWVNTIHHKRGWKWPDDNWSSISAWMLHHVEWLRHHEHGHIAVDELTGDMRQARRVIDVPANRTKFAVPGPCPEWMDPGVPHGIGGASIMCCPGEVWAYIPNTEDQPARLECNACHTIWESWQWMRLGKRIKDREATMKGTAA